MMHSVILSQWREHMMVSDMTGHRSFNDSMSKRVLVCWSGIIETGSD